MVTRNGCRVENPAPKTKEEAKNSKYGNHNFGYDETKCAAEVVSGCWVHQCNRKPGHGNDNMFCSFHSRAVDK